jgi:hypothetical protein
MGNDIKFENLEQISDNIISSNKKVHLLYAYNATGKTRLSMELKNKVNETDSDGNSIKHILYFNSYTEDLFTWDNDLEPAFPNCVTIITRKTAVTIDI